MTIKTAILTIKPVMSDEPRFAIGTQYQTRDKHPKTCTVLDILKTTNADGDVVKVRYVSQHLFAGQQILDRDVCDTTIARGLVSVSA